MVCRRCTVFTHDMKFHSNWCKLPKWHTDNVLKQDLGAKLDRILDIYRNEAAVQAHFSSRHNSQPSVHQVSTDSNSQKEGGEEDIHKLHDKRGHNQNTRSSSPENRYKHSGGRTCHWCGNKPQECPACVK